MTNDQKIEFYQEIVDKLIGREQLTAAEQNIVDTDDGFKEYQKEFNLITKAISYSAMEKKLVEVKNMETKYQDDKSTRSEIPNKELPKKKSMVRRLVPLAVAASVLLLASYFLFSGTGYSIDGQLLAEDHSTHFGLLSETRSTSKIEKGNPYYNYTERKHSLAVQDLKTLIATDDDPKHKFYLAVSYQRIGKWKESEKLLEDTGVQQLKDYPLNYFLAISKLGLSKIDEALELLQNPRSGNTIFNEEAEKIVAKINRRKK